MKVYNVRKICYTSTLLIVQLKANEGRKTMCKGSGRLWNVHEIQKLPIRPRWLCFLAAQSLGKWSAAHLFNKWYSNRSLGFPMKLATIQNITLSWCFLNIAKRIRIVGLLALCTKSSHCTSLFQGSPQQPIRIAAALALFAVVSQDWSLIFSLLFPDRTRLNLACLLGQYWTFTIVDESRPILF